MYALAGAAAGSIATAILGELADVFHIKENPQVAGYLLAGAVTISYAGCCPFFYLTAVEYEKFLKKAEQFDDGSRNLMEKEDS